MKTIKTLLTTGLVMAAAFALPKDHQGQMLMMNNGKKMMQNTQYQHMMVALPSVQCGMCKNTIETGMSKVDGINSINVDVDKKTAMVMYDPAKIDAHSVEQSIANLGYWANETPADPSAYENLAGCCQMTDKEYDQMIKNSAMHHRSMDHMSGMMKSGDHTGSMDHVAGMMEMGDHHGSMDHSGEQAMAMISLPTIQCGMCESRIERELPKTTGIISVDVMVDKKMAHIMYDPKTLTEKDVENAISKIGYQANNTPADAKAYKALPGCCKIN